MNKELLTLMQRHVAQLAANGSSLRNQGAAGVVNVARGFLEALDLRNFTRGGEPEFRSALDRETDALRALFPERARNWGAARKALNLFLRDCLYHTDLAQECHLGAIREWLEVPLDSQVASALHEARPADSLPAWRGIKWLEPADNAQYQHAALGEAEVHKVARVDLDLWYWRPA